MKRRAFLKLAGMAAVAMVLPKGEAAPEAKSVMNSYAQPPRGIRCGVWHSDPDCPTDCVLYLTVANFDLNNHSPYRNAPMVIHNLRKKDSDYVY